MRGLKHSMQRRSTPNCGVASFTDAWIETMVGNVNAVEKDVASFTDAWIETRRTK